MTEPRTFYNVLRGQEIVTRLHAIEQSHNVRVLYAIESGVGLGALPRRTVIGMCASSTCIRKTGISVHEQRDVIELPIDGDLDINGWDLRKALRLLLKGNPVLFEWLHSPILYLEGRSPMSGHSVMDDFRRVAAPLFNSTAAVYHYWHMAKGNFREYSGRYGATKNRFYVLRPVLACQWVLRGLGQPPMGFDELVHELLPQGSSLDEMISATQDGGRGNGNGSRSTGTYCFLEESLLSIEQVAEMSPGAVRKTEDVRDVDRLFRAIVRSREWSAC